MGLTAVPTFKAGASEPYSLDEFPTYIEGYIRKDYLLDRFGAVPEIPGLF